MTANNVAIVTVDNKHHVYATMIYIYIYIYIYMNETDSSTPHDNVKF